MESAEEAIEIERAENDVLAAEVAQLDGWPPTAAIRLVVI
jgi:hypothetical protein